MFEREAVLGRDAASVFPTQAKQAEKEGLDALREMVGGKKFISESEVMTGGVKERGDDRAALVCVRACMHACLHVCVLAIVYQRLYV